MTESEELTLVRDTAATVIPAGDERILERGTRAVVSQALGGSVTLRTDSGLYRVASKDWDALGAEAERALARQADEQASADAGDDDGPFGESQVWEALKQCFDPEIPVNIVDLGLIYDLQLSRPDQAGKHWVSVKMTLTAQGCGMGPVIADDAKSKIEALDAVREATVDIVWEPQWTPHMISEEGRKKLGLD